MGNVPSAEAPRRAPHKLSKPKTGNFTTAGLLGPNGYSNSTARFSTNSAALPAAPLSSYPSSPVPSPTAPPPSEQGDGPAADRETDNRAFLAPAEVKQQRRRSLFRSKSSQGAVERRNQRRNTIIGTTTPTTTDNSFPRSNSMTYESMGVSYYGRTFGENFPPAGSRTSWTYDLTSYEAKRLLNLVEEQPALHRSSTVSEIKLEAVSEVTWKSSHPAQPESTTISRANSDLSLYAPMRRRSIIQTPGVATRTRTPASSRPSFRHSHPATPSLSRQASFESNSSRILSMPPPRIADAEDVPRVVTPCETDYKTIGAFKLGSLRITNGSPILTPEISRTRKVEVAKSSPSREDYFSAGQNHGLGITGDTEPSRDKDKPLPRLKIPEPLPSTLSPVAAFFTKMDGIAASSTSPVAPVSSANGLDVQGEYLPEISVSPFSLEAKSPTSPQLQTTSKHTAVEDQLFEAEDDAQLEYSAVEVLEVRLDPNAKSLPPRPLANPSQKASGNVARSDSGFVSTSPTSESSRSHRPLAKADSGYSSNVSLRSFHGAAAKPSVPEKDFPRAGSEQEVSSPTTIASDQFYSPPPQREPPPPPLPPKDQIPTSPTSPIKQHTPRGSISSITRKPVRHTPSPINSSRSLENGPRSPDSIPLTPASAKSDASNSALSIGSGGRKPGKLQRLLSLSHGGFSKAPLTVHVTHAIDKSIPSVPQNVQAKLSEHTGLFPMTTKRLALKTQLSKETLKTIFSVGSLETTKDDPLPPLPTLPDEEKDTMVDNKESHLKLAVKSMESTIVHAAAAVIPRKPIARKPVPIRKQSQKEENKKQVEPEPILAIEAQLTTYNSINNSLGNNAYDAAFNAITDDGMLSPVRATPGRTMSMTTGMERSLNLRTYSLQDKTQLSQDAPGSPSLPSPLLKEKEFFQPTKQKTPPPVSMRTQRRPTSLRVPPPLRPQSTPPGAISLARKTSRESIHSYPSYQQQQPSVETSVAPPIPPMNPRRSMEYQRQAPVPVSQYRTPNWEVQTDHDPLSSRRSSTDQSRHNSMSSSSSQREFNQRPTSAQPYAQRPNAPPLRHRASYDGYNYSQTNAYAQPAPNQGPRAQPPQFDPWNNPQFNLEVQQWEQSGRYPRNVPRGHYRTRSIGGYGHHASNPPYRILHSYNSPAYRNVPIWG